MKAITIFALLFLVMCSCAMFATTSAARSDKDLFAEVGQVSAKVTVTLIPISQPCKAAASWRWGAENTCPRSVVGALEVKVGGKSIFIPLSAFADLGNPRNVNIESGKGKNRFAIVLNGGDAATSYTARFDFKDNILSERIVRHGEFPDQAWEKTTYKFNIGDRRK